MLLPFMPDTSKKIFLQINADKIDWESIQTFGSTISGTTVGTATPLFCRIDEVLKMAEIEAEFSKEVVTAEEPKEDNLVSIEDFAKLDIRVGKVLESAHIEGSDKLLVSKIKVGEKVLQIVSGIAKFYSAEEFVEIGRAHV